MRMRITKMTLLVILEKSLDRKLTEEVGGWELGAEYIDGKQLLLSSSPASKVMLSSHAHKR